MLPPITISDQEEEPYTHKQVQPTTTEEAQVRVLPAVNDGQTIKELFRK